MSTTQTERRHLDTATLRALAVKHLVDPRSIAKEYEEPGSVKGMAGARARAALADPIVTGPPGGRPLAGGVQAEGFAPRHGANE